MAKRLFSFMAGLLLCGLALLLLGVGAGVLFDAVKYHVLPVVLHVAASQEVVELENPTSVDPELEGELVEIVRTPVRCNTELEDADFGVKVKAVTLLRYWIQDKENKSIYPDEVDGFELRREFVAPEFRMGPYRILGEQARHLWRGDEVSLQPECIPGALVPYLQPGSPTRILLPEGGMQELAYSATLDGASTSYIGRQEGDTLVCDEEVLRLVYLRYWWLQAPGEVWEDVWGALPGLVFAYLLFCGMFLVLRFAVRLMFNGVELFRVSFLWMAVVALLGLLVGEICYAAASRAGMLQGRDLGDALGFAALALLVALCFVRRSAPAEKTLKAGCEKAE